MEQWLAGWLYDIITIFVSSLSLMMQTCAVPLAKTELCVTLNKVPVTRNDALRAHISLFSRRMQHTAHPLRCGLMLIKVVSYFIYNAFLN